jgi:hypothetical protein
VTIGLMIALFPRDERSNHQHHNGKMCQSDISDMTSLGPIMMNTDLISI